MAVVVSVVLVGGLPLAAALRISGADTGAAALTAAAATGTVLAVVAVAAVLATAVEFWETAGRRRERARAEAAQQRLREAEERLAGSTPLSITVDGGTVIFEGQRSAPQGGEAPMSPQEGPPSGDGAEPPTGRPGAVPERLTLPALWEVTHARLDLYHQIATAQARASFRNAQRAMWTGFALLIGFAAAAALTPSAAGAIALGALGAVSAAFAGYISRTFVRSQETTASHLRSYFDQPVEFSRFLAAERLLAGIDDLDPTQRATIIAELLRTVATPTPTADTTTPTNT